MLKNVMFRSFCHFIVRKSCRKICKERPERVNATGNMSLLEHDTIILQASIVLYYVSTYVFKPNLQMKSSFGGAFAA